MPKEEYITKILAILSNMDEDVLRRVYLFLVGMSEAPQ